MEELFTLSQLRDAERAAFTLGIKSLFASSGDDVGRNDVCGIDTDEVEDATIAEMAKALYPKPTKRVTRPNTVEFTVGTTKFEYQIAPGGALVARHAGTETPFTIVGEYSARPGTIYPQGIGAEGLRKLAELIEEPVVTIEVEI